MKKYLIIIAVVLVGGFFFVSSKDSKVSTEQAQLKEDLKTLAQVERNNIPSEPSDFETYTSPNFGFTMNVPKVITVYDETVQKEKDDTLVVRENFPKGLVYLVAKSDESAISAKGEIETSVDNPTVFMSTIFIRPLEKWKDVGTVLEGIMKESHSPLEGLKVASIERHVGVGIYTATFTFSMADEKGVMTEHAFPINFKAVFSSEHKKVAIWFVVKDYVFGHTVSGSTYKVFDDAIFDGLTFVK
jgi:hypothetical protein